ncbi:hypothetical protein [Leptolyngbya sp. FACHB-261]|uniref:hypothetical protein n=1 Tax=Leptolyngbya sp. FACHB-261 TaxID=2692806 RepID=UPI00168259CA|nr:hypothetical protein [Leptolyngbya sp. FACHB-261]MBD2103122.1 hypothetical protein [Leptolyngbya sp. FACHB-261]
MTTENEKKKHNTAANDHKNDHKTASKQDNHQLEISEIPDLDTLLKTVQGNLTDVDADTAIASIDQWTEVLSQFKDKDLKQIANGLKELKKLLSSGEAEAADIGDVLSQLGQETAGAASEAEEGTQDQLQKVGKALTKAGQSLHKSEAPHKEEAHPATHKKADHADHKDSAASKGKEQDHSGPNLDELLEAVEGDLTSLEAEAAINVIDQWHSALHKSEDENLKEIANGLKELKKLLKPKKSDASAIAEVLKQIGEQTVEAASDAQRGSKGELQKIGKALAKAGKSIEKAQAE